MPQKMHSKGLAKRTKDGTQLRQVAKKHQGDHSSERQALKPFEATEKQVDSAVIACTMVTSSLIRQRGKITFVIGQQNSLFAAGTSTAAAL